MSGLLGNLIDLLSEQKEYYSELVILAEEKKKVIIENDIENLEKITTVENILINKNIKLEEARFEIVEDIATVMNKSAEELTVTKIAEIITDEEQTKKLKQLSKELTEMIQKLKDYNEKNRELIQSSLEYIEFSVNVMQDDTPVDNGQELLNLKKGRPPAK